MTKLVTITGIDGAGKSTLAKAVTDELTEQGYSATYVYGRYLPRLAYPIMEFGRRTIFSETDINADYSTHQESKRQFFSGTVVKSLYEALIMMDYAPQLLYRLTPRMLTSDFIICDRYFYDTLLTDFSGTVIETPEEAISRYKHYSKLVPSPEYMFYLQIPVNVAYKRKDDTPSEDYLQERKAFYDSFAKRFNITELCGTDDVDRLVDQVLRAIGVSSK